MKRNQRKVIRSRVLFTYTDPLAGTVFVSGSFNEWNPNDAALTQVAPGSWKVEISLPPGRYEYLFVVDGRWTPDPLAHETAPNPHGGLNAVIRV